MKHEVANIGDVFLLIVFLKRLNQEWLTFCRKSLQ